MSELATEMEHLAKAERDITDGERHVTAQMLMVERLHDAGHDTYEAGRLLRNLRQSLQAWWDHRDAILRAIARLEQAPPP